MDAKKIEYKNGDFTSIEEFNIIASNTIHRCEYRNGKIYYMSPTSIKHKIIIKKLYSILEEYLKEKKCDVFSENLELYYNKEENYIYPDLIVVCDKENFINGKYFGKPKFVIEVLSSNKDRDYEFKKEVYTDIGVEEYLIFNQYTNTVEVFYLQENLLTGIVYSKKAEYKSKVFSDLILNLDNIFEYSDNWI
jgi:Uma2 family endonuclease